MDATRRPGWFTAIAVLALLWNLFGLYSFYLHYTADAAVVSQWPQVQEELHAATPRWIYLPFALATFGGASGSLGLLLARRWAVPVLLLSLLGIVVQFGSVYAVTPVWALTGIGGAVLPLVIAVVGVLLWLLARAAAARGWLA